MATATAPSREDFAKLLDETFGGGNLQEGSVIKGKVVGIEKEFAVIDVGLKTEGRVALREFIGPGRQAALKVGVTGEVVIGPAGTAGTYSAPLKITVTRESDKTQVFSKTYKVEATTDGVKAGDFRLVTEPIMLPLTTLQLADVYSISVGFEGGSVEGSAPKHRKHRTSG